MGWPEKRLLQYTKEDTVRTHAWEAGMKRDTSKVRQDLVWGGHWDVGMREKQGSASQQLTHRTPASHVTLP